MSTPLTDSLQPFQSSRKHQAKTLVPPLGQSQRFMTTCACSTPEWVKVSCYGCGRQITSQTVQHIVDQVQAIPIGKKVMILAPVAT